MTDFRVQSSWFNHFKRELLRDAIGDAGEVCLFQLWNHAAQSKTGGRLTGMTARHIEIAGRWKGEPGLFIATLLEARLLDEEPAGVFSLHDWAEHNPWLAGAEARSAQAKRGAEARWGKYAAASERDNMLGALLPASNSNAHSNAPSPFLSSPKPKPKDMSGSPAGAPNASALFGLDPEPEAAPPPPRRSAPRHTPRPGPNPDVKKVLDHYGTHHPRSSAHRSAKACRMVTARLEEGYSAEDLTKAIDNLHADTWADRHKYLALKYAVGDADAVDRWLNPPTPRGYEVDKFHDERMRQRAVYAKIIAAEKAAEEAAKNAPGQH